MLGTIIFGIIALVVLVVCIIECSGLRDQELTNGIVASIIMVGTLVLLWAFLVVCTAVSPDYDDTVKQGEEIRIRIHWMENDQVEDTIDSRLKLYRDIEEYNDAVKEGKKKCRNIWNGILIDDGFLELQKIEMPDWLQQDSSE